jgi:hypothetical protein
MKCSITVTLQATLEITVEDLSHGRHGVVTYKTHTVLREKQFQEVQRPLAKRRRMDGGVITNSPVKHVLESKRKEEQTKVRNVKRGLTENQMRSKIQKGRSRCAPRQRDTCTLNSEVHFQRVVPWRRVFVECDYNWIANSVRQFTQGVGESWRKCSKSCPTTRHGGTWGERRYSSYSFLTSALDGGEWKCSAPLICFLTN